MLNNSKQLQAKSKNCDDLKEMVQTSIRSVKQDLERKTLLIQNLTDKLKNRDEQINELQIVIEKNKKVSDDLKCRMEKEQHQRQSRLPTANYQHY